MKQQKKSAKLSGDPDQLKKEEKDRRWGCLAARHRLGSILIWMQARQQPITSSGARRPPASGCCIGALFSKPFPTALSLYALPERRPQPALLRSLPACVVLLQRILYCYRPSLPHPSAEQRLLSPFTDARPIIDTPFQMTTTSPAMKGPTEVLNISNFRATLSASPPRYMVQATSTNTTNDAAAALAPSGGRSASSSKVIERLTNDNDRLRRELRAERAQKEEFEEQLRAQKNLVASLQSQTSNLEHVHGSDQLLAERKDRRIAQLKESLEAEVLRRSTAEDKSREMGEKLGETAAEAQKEVAEAQTLAKRAEAAYDTLKASYSQLQGEMRGLRKRVDEVSEANRSADETMQRISILGEERDKHQAAAQQTNTQLRKRLDEYQARDIRMAKLEAEMEDAIRAMRWVVKLHGPQDS